MHVTSALPRNYSLFRSGWAHPLHQAMNTTKGLPNKPSSAASRDFHMLHMTPSSSTAYWSLLWINGMKNISSELLSNCFTVDMGVDNWAKGAAQQLEANAKCPSPGWGSTRPGLRVNWSSLTRPQHWTLHKSASGTRPWWLQGRAGTQESPFCEVGFTSKQNCYSGSPLPSQSCCTVLLYPFLTTQDSFEPRRTNQSTCETGSQPEFQ